MTALTAVILDPRYDQPRIERPRSLYLIASEERSGSNLLCLLLAQSGIAGVPLEYFHPVASLAAMRQGGHADFDAYLADLLCRRTTPNGVFGVKAHPHHYRHLAAQSRRGPPGRLRPIRLLRRDVAAQAVSHYIASRSGRWYDDGDGQPDGLDYDFAGIAGSLRAVQQQRAAWSAYFERLGVEPPTLDYETLAADPEASLRRVLGWLAISDPPASPEGWSLRKQGTGRNRDWAARFRAEAEARGIAVPPVPEESVSPLAPPAGP